jgi:hypothetical protein
VHNDEDLEGSELSEGEFQVEFIMISRRREEGKSRGKSINILSNGLAIQRRKIVGYCKPKRMLVWNALKLFTGNIQINPYYTMLLNCSS